MKTLRKNIDLDINTIAVLQIEATLSGYGSLKPYLEKLLFEKANKLIKEKPKTYGSIVEKRSEKIALKRKKKLTFKKTGARKK